MNKSNDTFISGLNSEHKNALKKIGVNSDDDLFILIQSRTCEKFHKLISHDLHRFERKLRHCMGLRLIHEVSKWYEDEIKMNTKGNTLKEDIKKILDKAILHTGYTSIITDWDDTHFNMFVMTGNIISDNETCHLRVGRVVQVRFGLGDFGSDIILLRAYNGDILHHENQLCCKIIYFICEDLEKIFPYKDAPDAVYTLENGTSPEKGFLIGENKIINAKNIIESHRSHK